MPSAAKIIQMRADKIIQILLHHPDSTSKKTLSMKNSENLDAKELLEGPFTVVWQKVTFAK